MVTKFYQIHVPKTGGVSLVEYAKKHKINWFSDGHKSFSERRIPEDVITLTALRCPVRQTISVYSFWKKNEHLQKEHSLYMAPFSDWLRAQKDLVMDWPSGKWRWFPNLYVMFFGDGDFEKATDVLDSIDHILDTTHLTRDFNGKVVQKYDMPYFDRHSNASKQFPISKDDLEYIKVQRAEDFEICNRFGIEVMG